MTDGIIILITLILLAHFGPQIHAFFDDIENDNPAYKAINQHQDFQQYTEGIKTCTNTKELQAMRELIIIYQGSYPKAARELHLLHDVLERKEIELVGIKELGYQAPL